MKDRKKIKKAEEQKVLTRVDRPRFQSPWPEETEVMGAEEFRDDLREISRGANVSVTELNRAAQYVLAAGYEQKRLLDAALQGLVNKQRRIEEKNKYIERLTNELSALKELVKENFHQATGNGQQASDQATDNRQQATGDEGCEASGKSEKE